MLRNHTTAPIVADGGGQLGARDWKPQVSEDNLLSKSLGDVPNSSKHLGQLHRSSSEIAAIAYRGYLLKRSNEPAHNISAFPVLVEPRTVSINVEDEGNEHATGIEKRTTPQHDPNGFAEAAITPVGTDDSKQMLIERSLSMMSHFFGIESISEVIQADSVIATSSREIRTVTPTPSVQSRPIGRSISRSEPIVFQKQKQSTPPAESIHRRDSAPSPRTKAHPPPPTDFVDEKDGHIWRSKYCVLEDGILYFYRNAADGESLEAHSERQQSPLPEVNSSIADLSRSPMPRFLPSSKISDSIGPGERGMIWEKRVPLDSVGAVRSAEMEYGSCAFQLLAVQDDEETTDRLVLRASNAIEMNEWLFQFHRSLATFMKNIVQTVEASPAWAKSALMALDVHHPGMNSFIASSYMMGGGDLTHSPQTRKMTKQLSLSHGHGRNGMYRRRLSPEASSSESIRNTGSPVPDQFTMEAELFRITPTADTSPPSHSTWEAAIKPIPMLEESPEISGAAPPEIERPPASTPPRNGKYIPPHLRGKQEKKKGRYIPPSQRRNLSNTGEGFLSLEDRARRKPSASITSPQSDPMPSDSFGTKAPLVSLRSVQQLPWQLGGCADPSLIAGSVVDQMYKPRSASKVGKDRSEPVGMYGGNSSFPWEIGAASECGIRDSNEDAFVVCNDLTRVSEGMMGRIGSFSSPSNAAGHKPAIFAIFDGHCGNQAARFASENLSLYLCQEANLRQAPLPDKLENFKLALRNAIERLDQEFCELCVRDGRAWESGSTAIVACLVDGHLVIANMGDCNAVMCRSVHLTDLDEMESKLEEDNWTEGENRIEEDTWTRASGGNFGNNSKDRWCFWKEVVTVHTPSRDDEQSRIKEAHGWVTTETEIPIGQLQRMDFADEDVVEILKRCFRDRFPQSDTPNKKCSAAPQRILHISRVCGELAVSRAVGDRDFKAAYNSGGVTQDGVPIWDGPSFLPYPNDHDRQFKGDLITGTPEIFSMKIEQTSLVDEFLLLACDGLWDVMDPDDAIRVTRDLLKKQWPTKKVAKRLIELAIHLGSSDNVTVIVIRFG